MKNSKILIFIIFIVILPIIWGALYLKGKVKQAQTSNSHSSNIDRQGLVQAFEGSYPKTVEASSDVVETDLIASEGFFKAIDEKELKGFSYNGQIPGPEIRLILGQAVKINFTNDLPQPTTIHFHGIRVPNAMDGVPGVTQEPIQSGESFTYEFTPKDAGTFWFHPHVRGSEQLEKGLYGIIIVEDPEEIGFSQDLVWVVDDWRLDETGQIDPNFNTMHDLMHDGRWGSIVTVNGKTTETLNLNPGQVARLRIVNVSNARDYRLNFGRLTAEAIAVDGMRVSEVFNANGFDLAPGNRIDVKLSASSHLSGQTVTISDIFGRISVPMAQVLVGEPQVEENVIVKTADIFPDWSAAVSMNPDYTFNLNAGRGMMHRGQRRPIDWMINNEMYPEITPTTLHHGQFYKLRIKNESARLHPMHLHGQFFQVLAIDGQPANQKYWRDTVLVYPNQTVDIGLVPTDEGDWAYHCHSQEHAEAGMMTLIKVD